MHMWVPNEYVIMIGVVLTNVKAEHEVWFIQFLSIPVNLMRINILDIGQTNEANGNAKER